ncbi:MAG: hypothetical protein HYZ12_03645 [Thaumarchaeota archaeon]|nr:hypothetical protein [Nitrososphaerota archaeon]
MSEARRERLSLLVIKLCLGVGGSFLAAVFILQAFLVQGFMIAGAISTFVLVAIVSYLFARIKPKVFSALTLAWLIALLLLHLWGV